MNLELNKIYNLSVKNEFNKFTKVGTIKKIIYLEETYYIVSRVGMFDICYNTEEINDFLKSGFYVEI